MGQTAHYFESNQESIVHPYYPAICFPSLLGIHQIQIIIISRAAYRCYQRQERWFDLSCQQQILYVHRHCMYPAHTSTADNWDYVKNMTNEGVGLFVEDDGQDKLRCSLYFGFGVCSLLHRV